MAGHPEVLSFPVNGLSKESGDLHLVFWWSAVEVNQQGWPARGGPAKACGHKAATVPRKATRMNKWTANHRRERR